jgi:hypothetical protein
MNEKPPDDREGKRIRRISATNLAAQLRYRGQGNPPSAAPESAPSNCYPGLVADFRAVWRRILVGIVLHEATNFVVKAYGELAPLKGHRLLAVDGVPLVVQVRGPLRHAIDDASQPLTEGEPGDDLVALEWANALAAIMRKAGTPVTCVFTKEKSDDLTLPELTEDHTITRQLKVRNFFERPDANAPIRPVIARRLAQPGELTQGLCSPWQTDFRECACYYWAASRPDYVNVEPDVRTGSRGHNWLARDRSVPPEYIRDPRLTEDERLLTETELLNAWERVLRFVIAGSDSE